VAVIEAQGVSKQFLLRHDASVELKARVLNLLHPKRRQSVEEFWALSNISMRIDRGEAVGLVGRNGSGKSTLLKLVAGIHRPTAGRLLVARRARICSMIELGIGFHPELTGRENVFVSAAIYGLSHAEIEAMYGAIVSYSGLEHFMDVPIKNYSSGMHMRLGFAIAANLDPDILLLDEIFAVGDADFQLRCVASLKQFVNEGKTIMFVSHAASAVRAICHRVCVLEHGGLTFDGDLEGGLAFYERSLSRPAQTADGAMHAAPVPSGTPADEAAMDRAPHRLVSGGRWRETGLWQYEFLRRQGLRPADHVLDVGCGSLAAAIHLLPFMEIGHYYGIERNRALFEAGVWTELRRAGVIQERGHFLVNDTFDLIGVPVAFDLALAGSLFRQLPFNDVARCIASVVRALTPLGRFYATWFENPDPSRFEPISHPNGVISYQDREPYHYPFPLVEEVCRTVGASVARVEDSSHPRGESVLVIARDLERAH